MHCARERQRVIEQGRGTPVATVVLAHPTTRGKDLRPRITRTAHSTFLGTAASGTASLISKQVYNERTCEIGSVTGFTNVLPLYFTTSTLNSFTPVKPSLALKGDRERPHRRTPSGHPGGMSDPMPL